MPLVHSVFLTQQPELQNTISNWKYSLEQDLQVPARQTQKISSSSAKWCKGVILIYHFSKSCIRQKHFQVGTRR